MTCGSNSYYIPINHSVHHIHIIIISLVNITIVHCTSNGRSRYHNPYTVNSLNPQFMPLNLRINESTNATPLPLPLPAQHAHPSWADGCLLILTSITAFIVSNWYNVYSPWINLPLFSVAAEFSAPSIPGNACAILLNRFLTLCPTFALVSMNMRLFFLASSSPCAVVTSRLSFKSVLFPTSTMITSLPRSPRTSSTHFRVFWKDFASGKVRESRPRKSYTHTRYIVYHHCHARISDVRGD